MKKNSFLILLGELTLFCFLNLAFEKIPLAFSAYVGLLYIGQAVLPLSFIYILSFAIFCDVNMIIVGVASCLIMSIIFYIYRRKNTRPKVEVVFYIFTSLTPYITIDFAYTTIEKLIITSLITLFSLLTTVSFASIKSGQNFNYKPIKELLPITILQVIFAYGLLKIITINFYKPLLAIILLSHIKSNDKNTLQISLLTSLPIIILTNNLIYFTLPITYYFCGILTKNLPSPITSLLVVVGELSLVKLTNLYPVYSYIQGLPIITALLFFGFIPSTVYEKIFATNNDENQDSLNRLSLLDMRKDISTKLYDISNCFYEMQASFLSLNNSQVDIDVLIGKMASQVLCDVCSECNLRDRCSSMHFPSMATLNKIITLSVAKGRLSLVDLPTSFTETCSYPNSIIFEINRLIGGYTAYLHTTEQNQKSKQLLTIEAEGVASAVKNLAFNFLQTISSENDDKLVIKQLLKVNQKVYGLTIFGGENKEVILITDKNANNKLITSVISKELSQKMVITKENCLSDNKKAITLKLRPKYDGIFGISHTTKKNSIISGDCHSLFKIDESHFLIALSDGMGSGKDAQNISSKSLSMIESLYKAGIDNQIILSIVNKVVSIAVDDDFSAIDIASVNLFSGECDFIKIGSPYGFILSETGIRFVEGSSLPLGILEDLKPTTARVTLNNGDMILMLSDGVTDTFKSSSNLLEFLKSAPVLNPQALTDSIINECIKLNNNEPLDDMTALAVRIFEFDE